MNDKKGFTLIELLVVIAIIALLLSIITPSLQKVKAKAREIFSLSNMKSLTLAWIMYLDNNEMKLVSGEVWESNTSYDTTTPPGQTPNGIRMYDWVHPFISETHPLYSPDMSDHERELAGIRSGALWPYLEDEEVYHSPGDRTKLETTVAYTAAMSPYRSYAITDAMSGDWIPEYSYHNMNEIKRPADRIVFVEEEDEGGDNWGSWILGEPGQGWWDPLAAWYSSNTASIFGFADGHGERHRWTEQSTFDMLQNQEFGVRPYPGEEGNDLRWVSKAYHQSYY